MKYLYDILLKLIKDACINTVCQKKGPLAKHENHKILKPFQGGLRMLVGPGRISGPVWPILSAIFSYFSNFTLQKTTQNVQF